jgi:cytochrome c oxidase subunit 2
MAYCVFRFRTPGHTRRPTSPKARSSNGGSPSVTARRRRGDAGARAGGLEASSSPAQDAGPRSRWSASSGSGTSACPGRTAARHRRQPGMSARQSARPQSPSDPARAQDDIVVEAADLHLPVGKPVKMLLRSIDVLHDFYVPEFRAKMDMIPGMVTYFWFTPTRTGTVRGSLRRTLRCRPSLHARLGRGRRPRRTTGLALPSQSWWTKYVFSPGCQGHRHPVFDDAMAIGWSRWCCRG